MGKGVLQSLNEKLVFVLFLCNFCHKSAKLNSMNWLCN